jgi:D-alanyl-D-alanine carboxypeptidase
MLLVSIRDKGLQPRAGTSAKPRLPLVIISILVIFVSMVLTPVAQARQPLAAIVVDARTGKVLYARAADSKRYPASITKVMTLYLLFRELRHGTISLNTRLKVSRKAARQQPSKLWLKPGQTITVDQAIRALAVKSANDVAMVVAENLAGSEAAFAREMTRVARAIGMTRTTFRNPSGLPRPVNVTTARDLATLSLRIQRDFPRLYKKCFSLKTFTWRGRRLRKSHRRKRRRWHWRLISR